MRSTLEVVRPDGSQTCLADVGPHEAEYLLRTCKTVSVKAWGRYAPGSYDHDSVEGRQMHKLFPNSEAEERRR